MIGAAAAAFFSAIAGGRARADESGCSALAGSHSFAQMQITGATWVMAGSTKDPGAANLPAYCEVTGVIRPVEGSEIGVVYRLPEVWSGKVLGIGGGGWLGNLRLAPEGASDGLRRGYATMQTDAGHPTTSPVFDASSWALNPDGSLNTVKVEDFSRRAIHLMTARGKEVVAAYYGMPPRRSYFQGCSTGGRMGLMEVQRYPDDFDGVIAGAPVYTLRTQTTQTLRSVAFNQPGARLLPGHLKLINDTVLARCDAKDGAADGVLRDPRACDFDPGVLQCAKSQDPATCLSTAQIAAVRRVYKGETTASGAIASYPLEKGGEPGWASFAQGSAEGDWGTNSGGLQAFRGPLLGDPKFDLAGFAADDVHAVRSSAMAAMYDADDPDIAKFVRNGGKLILWHGTNDPGPSMRATIEYYEAANKTTRGAAAATRLFLAPGVGHCRGGSGPDVVDWLTALDRWVELGEAPEEVRATKANSDLSWNLCAYPKLPTGHGGGVYACRK
jgi:feruloyl esterase